MFRLSVKEAVNKKKPGYYCDHGEPYLQVSDSGSKPWIFRFILNGKAKFKKLLLGLGFATSVAMSSTV